MIIKRKKAVFFNNNGEYEGMKTIKKGSVTFDEKSYVFNEKKSKFRTTNIIYITDYYFFNVKKEEGINIIRQQHSVLSPQNLYNFLESDFAKKLSSVARTNPLNDLLTPKNILLGIGVLLVILYFAGGGTIT